jgi:hypothetical protein
LIATLQLLNKTPLPVAGSDSHGPDVITYSDIMKVFKLTLYDPMKLYPQLADLLTSVSNSGSGADFAHSNRRSRVPYARTNHPKIPPHQEYPPYPETVLDTVTSIGCTDVEDLSVMSMDEIHTCYIYNTPSSSSATVWIRTPLQKCISVSPRPSKQNASSIPANLHLSAAHSPSPPTFRIRYLFFKILSG